MWPVVLLWYKKLTYCKIGFLGRVGHIPPWKLRGQSILATALSNGQVFFKEVGTLLRISPSDLPGNDVDGL